MTQVQTIKPAAHSARRLTAGFLLKPFRWAKEPLAEAAERDPALLSYLFEIDRERMHLVALALAHVEGRLSSEFVRLLVRSPMGEVLASVLGRQLVGIRRALQHMPRKVLGKDSYCRLVDLLEQPTSAKVLRHTRMVDDALLRRLVDVPPPLHWLVPFVEENWYSSLEGIGDGLRLLASRIALNFDELVLSLGRPSQFEQFSAKLKSVAEALPLPDGMPPEHVGFARRIDSISELRNLGTKWQNCLGSYADSINSGGCAVYLWENRPQAACLVRRHGRFGWFLEIVLGPQNSELAERDLKPIQDAFAEMDVHRVQVIETVEAFVHEDPRCAHEPRPRHQFPNPELMEDD